MKIHSEGIATLLALGAYFVMCSGTFFLVFG